MGKRDHAAEKKCCKNDDDEHVNEYAMSSRKTMRFCEVSLN